MMQRVVCSALRAPNGFIVVGPRHYDEFMISQINQQRIPNTDWFNAEQGFIDQFGKFLTRSEAYEIATLANQVIRHSPGDNGKLYSENLY